MLRTLLRGVPRVPVTTLTWHFEDRRRNQTAVDVGVNGELKLTELAIRRGGSNGGGERVIWITFRAKYPSLSQINFLREHILDQVGGLIRTADEEPAVLRDGEIHLAFRFNRVHGEEFVETAFRVFRYLMEVLLVPTPQWTRVKPKITQAMLIVLQPGSRVVPLGEYLADQYYPPGSAP